MCACVCVCVCVLFSRACAVWGEVEDELGLFAESMILSRAVELKPSTVQLWHKQLAGGDTAVALLNFGVFDGQHFNASFTTEMVGMSVGAAFKARDLFAKVDLGTRHGSFHAMLEATSILMLRLSPTAIA